MYPIRFQADYEEKRSRLTVFFRWVMIIPQYIVSIFYGIAVFVTIVIAWFALLFTARYPQGLYDFNAGVLRWYTRFQAYFFLMTDTYPSFGTAPDDSYPVRVDFSPPQERYSRLKTFFRFILAIPIVVLRNYVIGPLLFIVAVAAWFVIVITGRQLPGIHNALKWGMAYATRSDGYLMLLTERYPPFSEAGELEAGHAQALPPAAPPPGMPSPEYPAPTGYDPPQPPRQ